MQKVDLHTVLEMLINEEQDQAQALLHQWLVNKSKSVHESLMQEDDAVLEDNLSKDIADDQDEIKAEEHFSVSEAEDEDKVDADAGEELADLDADADAGEAADAGEDRVEDLEARLEYLKAEFTKLTQVADLDEPMADAVEGEAGEEAGDDLGDLEAPVAEENDALAFEAADDFQDLEEAFKLEPVKVALDGAKEIGADGDKLNLNDESPVAKQAGPVELDGEAVEIKSDDHDGFDLEAAPEVKAMPLRKNQVKKAADALSKVADGGDKSAKLNSKEGFGTDSPASLIGGSKKKGG